MAVATTGFFDGVHRGHQKIIETLLESSKELDEQSLIITFWPHPRVILGKDDSGIQLLTDLDQKLAMLKSFGVDKVEVLEFTQEFATKTTKEYLQYIQERFQVNAIVIGYDNKIGSDQMEPERTAEVAGELGIKVIMADVVLGPDGKSISSSSIRKALSEGDELTAHEMLGW